MDNSKFSKESLTEQREVLQSLARHPGFALFLSVLEQTAQSAYRELTKTGNPHDAAKHLGAHFAVTQLQTWLPRELEMIRVNLEQLAQDAS